MARDPGELFAVLDRVTGPLGANGEPSHWLSIGTIADATAGMLRLCAVFAPIAER